ncbi:LINE-1 retrotransposable element ORF1 protein [Dissostichus eleginoides]|uniref:LINE-1 retrotransposable element ORF1 protein n=1 Tax=Dissostichus eleginoides TaxID=100907 RepID=A0AAD9C9Y9_DISEL|nr:LINE-1 retrotransposable element ORF1 protein [Dissostichus eleginoides]
MPNTKKIPKTVVNATQQHLLLKANASPKPANVSPDISVLNSAATEPTNTAILELLQKLSEDQTKHFTDLRKERRAVVAVEEKLADVLTRITSAEAQLDMLEDTEDQRRNSPPALASEVETLNAKLVEYEDRDRRVNLRIYGLPEHSEEKDALSFLKTALPDILQTDFPGGLDLERAHRSLVPIRTGAPPRPFVVSFLRFQQKEHMRNVAREIGDVRWKTHEISFYQDFSKATQDRRRSFLECKRLLHSAKIPFGIGYPAVLYTGGAKHRFDDPKKAMQCIRTL